MPPTTPAATLVSGEGVRLDLTRAGVGSRTIATLIDVVFEALTVLVVFLVDIPLLRSTDVAAGRAVVLTEFVLVVAGYPIVAEWTRGRTVGKACLGLRVLRDDGGPIGFRQALVRGLAGLVIEKPGLLFPLSTMAGVLTAAYSSADKRIGDMMAGTIVVDERATGLPLAPLPLRVAVPLQPWVLAADLHGLDDALALQVRRFVGRAGDMTVTAQHALGEDLRRRVLAVVSPPPPADAPTPHLLAAVLVERSRRSQLAGAPRPAAPVPVPRPPTTPTGNGPFAAPH